MPLQSKILLLENIRSLHNVGAMFRTADGAGWGKLILCGYTGTPPDRRIEKVSLGAEEFVAWEQAPSCAQACQDLKADGYTLVALEQTDRAEDLFEHDFQGEKLALVVGNEVEGVSEEVLELCDHHIEIPMQGQKASLNVSVAAGIAMYGL